MLEVHFDRGTDAEERAEGTQAGMKALLSFTDRAEFLDVLKALDGGSYVFVLRLQRSSFVRDPESAEAPLPRFVDHMFGAADGIDGPYAQAFIGVFQRIRPLVEEGP